MSRVLPLHREPSSSPYTTSQAQRFMIHYIIGVSATIDRSSDHFTVKRRWIMLWFSCRSRNRRRFSVVTPSFRVLSVRYQTARLMTGVHYSPTHTCLSIGAMCRMVASCPVSLQGPLQGFFWPRVGSGRPTACCVTCCIYPAATPRLSGHHPGRSCWKGKVE